MATWHPSHIPHTNHTSERYWHGVSQLVAHSNFEQPRVSVRQGPAQLMPLPEQPAITGGAQLGTAEADSQGWRADEQPEMGG